MSDLKFFDRYRGQSTETLLALEGRYRTDSLVLALESALSRKEERSKESVSDEERVVLAVEALEREVNNGGYHQFFINSSGRYAPTIVAALKTIGCRKTAKVTQKAIDLLELADGFGRRDVLSRLKNEDERLEIALGRCDKRFWAVGEDIAEALFRFIKANRERIRLR